VVSNGRDGAGNNQVKFEKQAFSIDTKKPKVKSAVFSRKGLIKAGKQNVVITFSEDVIKDPSLTITVGIDKPYTQKKIIGEFSDSKTWKGSIDLGSDFNSGKYKFKVTGAQDPSDNIMADYTANAFTLDVDKPSVKSVNVSKKGILIAGSVNISFTTSEPILNSTQPVVTFGLSSPFTQNKIAGKWFNGTTWQGKLVIGKALQSGDYKISINNISDLAGNIQSTANSTASFTLDTKYPEVLSVEISDKNNKVKAGPLDITVSFSEAMSKTKPIKVTAGNKAPFKTLIARGAWENDKTWKGKFNITNVTANGEYTIKVSNGRDSAGNLQTKYEKQVFTVDTKKPKVLSAIFSRKGLINAGKQDITITFSEEIVKDALPTITLGSTAPYNQHKINGSLTDSKTWKGSVDLSGNFKSGKYKISVLGGKDISDNIMSPFTAHAFTLDLDVPAIKNVSFSPKGLRGPGGIKAVIKFSEPINASTKLEVSFDSKVPFTAHKMSGKFVNPTTWSGSGTITKSLQSGKATLKISSVSDKAGNKSAENTSFFFEVDTKIPEISSVTLNGSEPIKKGVLTITAIFNEEMNTAKALKATMGMIAPFNKYVLKGTWKNKTTWSGSITVSKVFKSGMYTINIGNGTDKGGNVMNAYTGKKLNLDPVPPLIVSSDISHKDYISKGIISVTVKFNEEMNSTTQPIIKVGSLGLSGKWKDALNWTGTVTINDQSPNGKQTIIVSAAQDKAGNTLVRKTVGSVTIDTKAPSIAGGFVKLENGQKYSNKSELSFSYGGITDAGSGIATYYYGLTDGGGSKGGTANMETSGKLKVVKDGLTNVYIWAEDKAGNISKSIKKDIIIDRSIPGITSVNIAGSGVLKAGKSTITVTFSEKMKKSKVPVLTFGKNAPFNSHKITGSWKSDMEFSGFLTLTPAIENGENTISITSATDLAGNVIKTHTGTKFKVDTKAPLKVKIDLNKKSPVNLGELGISITFNEAVQKEVFPIVKFGSNPANAISFTGAWESATAWKGKVTITSAAKEGLNNVYISAVKDLAGNVMKMDKAKTFTLDSKAPQVVAAKLNKTGPYTIEKLSVDISFNEAMDQKTSLTVTFGSGDKIGSNKITGSWTGAKKWTGSADITGKTGEGSANIRISSGKDLAGNTLIENTKTTFLIDTKAPDISKAMVVIENGILKTNKKKLNFISKGITDGDGVGVKTIYYSLQDKGKTRDGTVMVNQGSSKEVKKDGLVKIYIWAEDKAGNISAAIMGSISVDITPPQLLSIEVKPPLEKDKGNFRIALQFNEDMQQSSKPEINFSNGREIKNVAVTKGKWDDATHWSGEISMSKAMAGSKFYITNFTVADLAGNNSTGFSDTLFTLDALSYVYYADHLQNSNEFDLAIKYYDEALKIRPNLIKAYVNSGKLYAKSNDLKKAEDRFSAGLNYDPLNMELISDLGGVHESSKNYSKSIEIYKQGLDIFNASGDRLTKHNNLHVQEYDGEYIALKNKISDIHSTYFKLGMLSGKSNAFTAAVRYFEKAINLENNTPEAHYNLGKIYYHLGNYEKASEKLYQALGMDSELTDASIMLANIDFFNDSLKLAIKSLNEISNKTWGVKHNLALIKALQGDIPGAAKELGDLVKNQGHWLIKLNHSALLINQGKSKKPAQYLITLRKQNPDHGLVNYYSGLLSIADGNTKKAEAYFLKAVHIKPQFTDANFELGNIYKNTSLFRKSELWYQRALFSDNTFINAFSHLGFVYGKLDQKEKELASYSAAQKLIKEQERLRAASMEAGKVVAVTSFENTSKNETYGWLSIGIAEALSSDLKKLSNVRLVERLNVENLMMEKALSATDIIGNKLPEFGKTLGAEFILTGSFQINNNKIRIDAKILNGTTAEVTASANAEGMVDDIFELQLGLALKLLKSLGITPDETGLKDRGKGSLEALKFLSEGKSQYYAGNMDASLKNMRKAISLYGGFVSELGDMNLLTSHEKKQKTIAILEFGNSSGDKKYDWLRKGISEAITTDLKKVTGLYLVERLALNKAMEEIHLGMTDIVDVKTAPKIGEMVGAGVVLVGSYQIMGKSIRIDGRMVEVETGNILMGESVQGPSNNIFDLEEELALKIADNLNIAVSDAERELIARKENPSFNALKSLALSQSGLEDDGKDEGIDKAMSILKFKNNSSSDIAKRYNWLQTGILEVLTTEFKQSKVVRMVDQSVLEAQIGEENIAKLVGMGDGGLDEALQKRIPANFILLGGYQISGDNLRIDGRLVEVETGSILFTETANGSKNDALSVEMELAGKIIAAIRKSTEKKTSSLNLAGADTEELKSPTLWLTGSATILSGFAAYYTIKHSKDAENYKNGKDSELLNLGDVADNSILLRAVFLTSTGIGWLASGGSYVWNKYLRPNYLNDAPEPAVSGEKVAINEN